MYPQSRAPERDSVTSTEARDEWRARGARHDASREPRRPHRRRQPVWMDSSSGLPNHIPSSDVFYFIRSPVISAKAGELSFRLCWTGAAEGPARSGIRVGEGLLRSILSTASDPQALQ